MVNRSNDGQGDQNQDADGKPKRNWFAIILVIFGLGVLGLVVGLSIVASIQSFVGR